MVNINAANFKLKILCQAANPGQTVIDNAVDKYDSDTKDIFVDICKPVVSHLKNASGFKDAMSELPDLIPKMKTNSLEDNFLKLRFMSEVTGHYTVQKETKKQNVKNLIFSSPYGFKRNLTSKGNYFADLELAFDKSPEDAVKYLEKMGIDISFDWKQTIKILKEHNFTIAKVESAQILQLFKDELQVSLETGTIYEDFVQNINLVLENRGYIPGKDHPNFTPSKLNLIYRMNTQNAYMRGRYLQQKDVTEFFPYWEFVAVLDDRTTDFCYPLNGIVARNDETFWNANYPPLHYNCRSTIRTLNDNEIDKRGIKVSNDDSKVSYVDEDGNLRDFVLGDVMPAEGFDNTPDEFWECDYNAFEPAIRKALITEIESY